MVVGTPTIIIKEQLVGGPKVVSGTVTCGAADTAIAIDLSAYFAEKIKTVVTVFVAVAAALTAVETIDITTVATTLTLLITAPGGDATVHFTVIGQ